MEEEWKGPFSVQSLAFGESRDLGNHSLNTECRPPNEKEAPTGEINQALFGEPGEGIHPVVLDHLVRPRNAGVLTDPDGEATLARACGDGVCIQVRLRGDRVDQVRFMTNGCGAMVACGSMVTELAQGLRLQHALAIDARQVMDALEGLPDEEEHCAVLATQALKAALRDALMNQREPWKRPYRKKGS